MLQCRVLLHQYLCQQYGQFAKLALDTRTSTKVKDPLTGSEKAAVEARKSEGKAFLQGDYADERDDAISCIKDGGAFVVFKMDKLDDPSSTMVVSA